ncbi:MAG: hypothetical protein RR513_06800, partial [Muribaculaceae bacterium]
SELRSEVERLRRSASRVSSFSHRFHRCLHIGEGGVEFSYFHTDSTDSDCGVGRLRCLASEWGL